MEQLKFVALGAYGCGKTTFIQSYQRKEFQEEVNNDDITSDIHIIYRNKPVVINYFDLNASLSAEGYLVRLRKVYMEKTNVFLLCFDVSNAGRFQSLLHDWYPDMKRFSPNAKIVLVGMKTDIRHSNERLASDYKTTDYNKAITFVQPNEAKELAIVIGAHAYVECSAYANRNASEVINIALSAHFGDLKPTTNNSGLLSSFKSKLKKLGSKSTYDEKLVVSTTFIHRTLNIHAHAAACANGKMYLFGGYKNMCNEYFENPMVGDTTSPRSWQELKGGNVFTPRTALCAVSITTSNPNQSTNESFILLFGGKSNGYHNDVISLNTRTHQFQKLECTGEIPSPRYGMTGVTGNGGTMVIFGGFDRDSSPCNDCFLFFAELREWRQMKLSGDIPSPRYYHAAVAVPDKNLMLVYGGKNGDVIYDDMYTINLDTGNCTKLATKGSEGPGPRQNHACVYIGRGNVLLIGGMTKNLAATNDVYIFSLSTQKWTKANVKGSVPTFYSHAAVQVESDAEIWVSGGRDAKTDHYLTKMRIAKNTPRIYDVLPAVIVRDVLRYLSVAELGSLAQVNAKFSEIACDSFLWEQHAKAIDPSYTLEKDGEARKYVSSYSLVWYNDFKIPAQAAPVGVIRM